MPVANDIEQPEASNVNGQAAPSQPRRIVLCFDGTGNKFQGDESDTNIVKIYEMLEKKTPGQYHYYQPGIGTYQKGAARSSAGFFNFFSRLRSNFSMTMDQAVGASFVDHVIAGYEFCMRYYSEGDHIYIFGFSRGAYTARFLAEMIHNIGLLSKGNEEMVEFAWQTFSQYQESRGNDPQTAKDKAIEDYQDKFKNTFCRPEVSIHFIGLFDCVNSVGQFEVPLFRTSFSNLAEPAATHIRHAVSIHERRLKFKPALFHFDPSQKIDLKEVWFAGNHADVGGGWGLAKDQKHLLSDTPLNWMIQEVLNLPGSESKLEFTTTEVGQRDDVEHAYPEQNTEGHTAEWELQRKTNQPHDMLKFGRGATFFMTMMWWLMEIIPAFTRLELEDGKWVPRHWPPNLGAPRDIPGDAVIHESVDKMIQAGVLKPEDIQAKGGDNEHFSVESIVSGKAARSKSKTQTNGTRAGSDDRTPLLKQSGANGS